MKKSSHNSTSNRQFCFVLFQLFCSIKYVVAFSVPGPIVDFGIGSLAGSIGSLVVYPIDFVKTQLQASSEKTALSVVKDTLEERGIFGFYRGALVQVLGVAPEKAIKLSVNDAARNVLLGTSLSVTLPFQLPTLIAEMLAGSIAGTCQVIITNPLEVTKIALQTSDARFSKIWDEIGGFKGLYRGADACILRDSSFSLILFPLYSHAKVFIPQLFESSNLPAPLVLALSGFLAATPAAFLTTPADVIKTRQQSLAGRVSSSGRIFHKTVSFGGVVEPHHEENLESQSGSYFGRNKSLSLLNESERQTATIATQAQTVTPTKKKVNHQHSKTYHNHQKYSLKRSLERTSISRLSTVTPVKYTQTDNLQEKGDELNENIFQIGQNILQTEGAGVLFSGGVERVFRSAPQFAVTLALFDILKTYAIENGIVT